MIFPGANAFERQSCREGRRDQGRGLSVHCFAPLVATSARARPGGSQMVASFGSLTCTAEAQVPGPSSDFPGKLVGSWTRGTAAETQMDTALGCWDCRQQPYPQHHSLASG